MEIDKEGNIDKEDNQQNNRYNYDSTDGSQDENENFNSEGTFLNKFKFQNGKDANLVVSMLLHADERFPAFNSKRKFL